LLLFFGAWFQLFGLFWMVTGLPIFNNNGMTLLGFKTILHKKCRFGKNSEGPAENSWVL
jgi:hypothetical protein